MTALKRLAAGYMLLLAVAVAAHFVATQLYDPTLEGAGLTVWRILDPLMVAGVVMALIAASARKRHLDANTADRSVSREYIETNVTLYYSAGLLLVLLWNWLGIEWVDPPNDNGLVWILIDATLPLLLASTAIRLLRDGSAQTG